MQSKQKKEETNIKHQKDHSNKSKYTYQYI